jgi:hypothetical protein
VMGMSRAGSWYVFMQVLRVSFCRTLLTPQGFRV